MFERDCSIKCEHANNDDTSRRVLPLDPSLSTCLISHLSPCSVHPWPPPPREACPPHPRGRFAQHNAAGYVHPVACGSDQARTPSLSAQERAPPPAPAAPSIPHHHRGAHACHTLDSGRTCSVLLSQEKSKGPTSDRHQLAKGDRESGST